MLSNIDSHTLCVDLPGIGRHTSFYEALAVSYEYLAITTNISLFKVMRAKSEGAVATLELAAYN